jgi:hypothetical protein
MRLPAAAIVCVLLTSGCPQLMEDDFRLGDALTATGGAPQAGAGNDGGSTSTPGGAGGDGGAGSSGAGGSAAGPCAAGAQLGPSGACYVVIASTEAWDTARASCQAEGSGWDLATVRGRADTAFILELLDDELWIGASDAALEGRWIWIATGDVFWPEAADAGADSGVAVYTNWNEGEPNNVDGADCLRLLTTGEWADLPCDDERGALCTGPAK